MTPVLFTEGLHWCVATENVDTEITSQAIGQELPVSFIFHFSNKTRIGCWESSFPFGIFWKNKMVLKLSEGCVEQPAGNHWHHEIFPRATSPEVRHGTPSYRSVKLWHFPPEGAPTVHPAYSNPIWRAEILSKGKCLHSWHGGDREKGQGGCTFVWERKARKALSAYLSEWRMNTYLYLKTTFSSNMIIPSRGQYMLKYSSMHLIIQLHPHIPVTPSLQFSSEKTSRAWMQQVLVLGTKTLSPSPQNLSFQVCNCSIKHQLNPAEGTLQF